MALTRKFLRSMGIEDEKIDQIIEAHTDTVNALKDERDELKEKTAELADVQKQLEQVKAETEKNSKDTYKVKYDALKEEFEGYKKEVTATQDRAKKETAYRAMLKEVGVNEKRIDAVIKVTDLDAVELDENGSIKDRDKAAEAAKTEWADFIQSVELRGANPANPPQNSGVMSFESMNITEKMSYANAHPNAPEVTAWLKG